jgi:hypothetical protein
MYNLNYTPTTLGYKAEEKLHVGVREQKRINTTGLEKAHIGPRHSCGFPNSVRL